MKEGADARDERKRSTNFPPDSERRRLLRRVGSLVGAAEGRQMKDLISCLFRPRREGHEVWLEPFPLRYRYPRLVRSLACEHASFCSPVGCDEAGIPRVGWSAKEFAGIRDRLSCW